jgi:hypothetical protein
VDPFGFTLPGILFYLKISGRKKVKSHAGEYDPSDGGGFFRGHGGREN